MLSKSTLHNPNYLAKVVLIKNLRKHINADRLLVFTVDGNDIITSNSTQEGTIGIYFPLECQISDNYLKSNNEYKTKELNSDVNAPAGFFEDKRRVKAVRLRGEKSMGYVAPISTLEYLLGDKYNDLAQMVGEEFDTINGELLVNKYVVKEVGASLTKARNSKIKESKIVENQFRLHYDTEQLKKNLHRLKPEDIISLSWKMHGTSFVSSKILCKRKLTWWERLLQWCGVRIESTEYDNIYSSRKVIKNEDLNDNKNSYYETDLWKDINELFKADLHSGETIYGECVGFEKTGGAIQRGYDYGCKPGESKVFIYRITYTSVEGKVIDLPFNMVQERAVQLGVETVPFIYFGPASAFLDNRNPDGEENMTDEEWRDKLLETLTDTFVYDQDCQFCMTKVPAEGVVLRKEGYKAEAFKLKAWRFLERETKELDKGEVNIEDQDGSANTSEPTS